SPATCSGLPRARPSFPTRRSSDLGDDFVARVVDYEPARQNYFSLTEIPKRLGEHADRLEALVEEEEEKLAALERAALERDGLAEDRKSTRLNSSHVKISYAVFCLK